MDRRSWERINSDIALNETNQQLEPQRLELYQANQWPDQGQRESCRLFGELSTKNRIYKANRATDCPEIAVLQSDNWELMDFLCNRKRLPLPWISFCPNSGTTGQGEFLPLTGKNWFSDPETASSSGMSHIPSQPWEFRVLEEWLAAILVCRTIHGIRWVHQETFLKIHLLKEDDPQHSSRIQAGWHHFLVDWDQVAQEIPWNMKKEWDESHRVQ